MDDGVSERGWHRQLKQPIGEERLGVTLHRLHLGSLFISEAGQEGDRPVSSASPSSFWAMGDESRGWMRVWTRDETEREL